MIDSIELFDQGSDFMGTAINALEQFLERIEMLLCYQKPSCVNVENAFASPFLGVFFQVFMKSMNGFSGVNRIQNDARLRRDFLQKNSSPPNEPKHTFRNSNSSGRLIPYPMPFASSTVRIFFNETLPNGSGSNAPRSLSIFVTSS